MGRPRPLPARIVLGGLLCLALGGAHAWADVPDADAHADADVPTATPSAPDPVSAWVTAARARHPSLAAVTARVEAAEAAARAARLQPDLQLMVQYANAPFTTGWIGDHPMAGLDVRLTQRITPGAEVGARVRARTAEAAAQAAQHDEAAASLDALVRGAAWRLAHAEAALAVVADLRSEIGQARLSVEAATTVGRARVAEGSRLVLLDSRLARQADALRATADAWRAALDEAVGTATTGHPPLPEAPVPFPVQALPAGEGLPSVVAARATAAADRAAAEAARRAALPDVSVFAGVRGRFVQTPTDPGTDLFTVGLGLPLPTAALARARREAASHEARARAADARAEALGEATRTQLARLLAEHTRSAKAHARVRDTELPAARAWLDSERSRLASGTGDGRDLSDAARAVLEAELARLEALRDTLLAAEAARALLPPEEVSP